MNDHPGQQPKQLPSLRKIALVTGLIVFLLFAVLAIRDTLDSRYCTVGVTGTAANVTFQGWNSHDVCNNARTYLKGLDPSNALYQMPDFQGTELCQGQFAPAPFVATVTYTVRDTGLLYLEGHNLCQWFEEKQ